MLGDVSVLTRVAAVVALGASLAGCAAFAGAMGEAMVGGHDSSFLARHGTAPPRDVAINR